MSRPLVLTLGDPAGCGPQITAKAWTHLKTQSEIVFFIIGEPALYERYCPVQPISHPSEAEDRFSAGLPVLPLGLDLNGIEPGNPDIKSAPAILGSIEKAVALCRAGEASALITNPIHKALLYQAGFPHAGHTEYLAHLSRPPDAGPAKPVMMLVGGGLRVALATLHIPLMQAAANLSIAHLMDVAKITHTGLRQAFGLAQPRLVFTGLNPHAGEDGTIGREEIEIINPAAKALRKLGIDMADARPADSVYAEALSGAYDGVIAMTHDQGLIPVKTLDLWGGVNVTLGLPIIRTSPDHGTAYEAARSGLCREDSLMAAIHLAHNMSQHRAHAQNR